MKGLWVVGTLLVGCGGSDEPQLSYTEWAERTASAMCSYAERCEGSTAPHAQCVEEIRAAYAGVELELNGGVAGAKMGCVQCMRIRTEELEAALASDCQQAPDEARVSAVCGVDDAACAGAP
ncbi:hypothetical protein JY651_42780 [Pyxidicoccus parkwayensis]|uniref:Lipoprotein n=1 Tax=Pyxidicoccus parkwayensis TaxID=2813578 RepID=A0ABX7NTJ9_9BACT|nr:hypothetical protein [Pyxidicoccus parkwaysis]QSQ21808.1 hypothetical protein JY651_42780 [Pyxidicoccus parkwaysis]